MSTTLWTPPPAPRMALRPYQQAAVDGIFQQWEKHQSTLLVLPTGTGKTIVFAHVVDRLRHQGRIKVVAHRDELIRQAADKIHAVTGERPDIEMAAEWADHRARIVVTSVQSQNAKLKDIKRMQRFDPDEFALLVIDEAHHAPADTYRRLIDHYRQNPQLKVLGVTATPDRLDELALGQIFESVAYDYEIEDAIRDGYLVDIHQHSTVIEGLDLSKCRTTAGDLNSADLARVMEYEQPLLGIADATFRESRGRKTLLFATSVAHAERLAEIFNRYETGCARWVCGKTPKDERRDMIRAYAAGEFAILCNVGVATEGFDEPGIECISMARPTKSRALYAQAVGRGTRPLTGVVDPHDTSADRVAAIAASSKTHLEVLDFVGNAGRHRLMSCADILGGRYAEAVVERARQMQADGDQRDTTEVLEEAEEVVVRDEAEARRRLFVKAKATYKKTRINPFTVFGLQPARDRAWDVDRPVSDKMRALLEKNGVDVDAVGWAQARQLTGQIISRAKKGLCSMKQGQLLMRFGYLPAELTRAEASKLIDMIKAAGWKRPEPQESEAY